MRQVRRVAVGLFVGICTALLVSSPAWAQAERVKAKGKVLSVAPGSITMSAAAGKIYTIKVPKTGNVIQVVGNLPLEKLQPGTIVRFSGKLKGKAALGSEISKLTVYSPLDGYQLGILQDDPAQEAVITGKVTRIAKNLLTVSAGRARMTGKLAAGAEIVVDSKDYSIAKAGDAIEAEGTLAADGSVNPRKVVVTIGTVAAP
jgi:hypothetical protein